MALSWKWLAPAVLFLCSAVVPVRSEAAHKSKIPSSCVLRGKKLWGKVQLVKHTPDFKVKVVKTLADLRVKKVTAIPRRCGEWQLVRALPDLRIQLVRTLPDFTIQLVDNLPGLP